MSSLTCDEVRDMLAARELALGLAPDGARALDEHLAACAPCREALLEAQDVSALLESALAEQADDACAQAARIASALPVRGARRAAVRPRVSWAAVAGRVVR